MNARASKPVELPLSGYFSISGRFRRSVHIERDRLSTDALVGYRPTPVALKTLERIFAGLEPKASARAWSVTGPYGSGKSSFVMFLAALLAIDIEDTKAARSLGRKLLRETSEEYARELLGESGRRAIPRLCPVLITGERQPLGHLLLRGLATALQNVWGSQKKPKALNQIFAQADAEAPSSRLVIQAFENATLLLRDRELADGVLLVLDEAGKVLEHAAQNPDASDVLLLQELAEFAARSGSSPFVFITVFHQAFAGYAARLGPTQRNEWEKVQGRFEDVAFVDNWDQTLQLIGDAIEPRNLPTTQANKLRRAVDKALVPVQLPPALEVKRTTALLNECVPLHPHVALLLGPLFRSGVFQNERSLFAFLASLEPGGLQEFLGRERFGARVPLYPLDSLYDYVDNVLQSRASFSRPHALRVTDVALQRVPDEAGRLGTSLVKSIALLSWLGEKVGLRADVETLSASRPDQATVEDVRKCLDALQSASVVTYRRFRSSFVVWEGSDIPIDEVLASAAQKILSNGQAAALLESISPLDPIVARRHLFQTGALRYFPVQFVAAEKLAELLAKPPTMSGDGNVFVVVMHNELERRKTIELLRDPLRLETAPARPVLCVLPLNPSRLFELVGEYAALEQLVADDPRLPHDPVAKREIEARKLDIEAHVAREVERILGVGEGECGGDWWRDGQRSVVASARQLSSLLSDVCDDVFDSAPHIFNELVNRNDLSSAAASARRNLLTAMLAKPSIEAFGIEGYPPEMSMYLSIFGKPHRLHADTRGGWRLKEPVKKTERVGTFGPVWHFLRKHFETVPDQRLDLESIYVQMEAPPFGMKRGVIPILFLHFFAMNAASLALYENDAFVPKITEAVVERLLKSAKNFQVQWFPLNETRQRVLQTVGRALGVQAAEGAEAPTVLQVVKHLLRITADLQRYSQLTKRVSPQAVAVRDALMQAKEPAPLLFKQLPRALGVEPFRSDGPARKDSETYARAVAASVQELAQAYERLLDSIEEQISSAFGLKDLRGHQLQRELAERGARVFPHAIAPKLRAFLLRIVDDSMPRSEWLISVGTLLASKPPEHWIDADYELFRTELHSVRRAFSELESLALADESTQAASGSTRRLFRLAIAELGSAPRERVVTLSPSEEKLAVSLRDQLRDMLHGFQGDLTLDARLATLSAVAAALIQEAERESSSESAQHEHD